MVQVKTRILFFYSDEISPAIISEKSTIKPLVLKETQLFDVPTQKGRP